jgi:hypothetical protein
LCDPIRARQPDGPAADAPATWWIMSLHSSVAALILPATWNGKQKKQRRSRIASSKTGDRTPLVDDRYKRDQDRLLSDLEQKEKHLEQTELAKRARAVLSEAIAWRVPGLLSFVGDFGRGDYSKLERLELKLQKHREPKKPVEGDR